MIDTEFLEPELIIIVKDIWFKQGGATSNFGNDTIDLSNQKFISSKILFLRKLVVFRRGPLSLLFFLQPHTYYLPKLPQSKPYNHCFFM